MTQFRKIKKLILMIGNNRKDERKKKNFPNYNFNFLKQNFY